ncbi:MAG: ATP-binding protein [Desulfobacteraceae bacterium]|nr:ATP-binding protein [Desulfobacteraceae bacterium]
MDNKLHNIDHFFRISSESAALIEENGPIFRTLIEAIPSGLALVDANGRIVYWNLGAERMTGLKRDEVVGRTCKEIFNCPNFEKSCPLSRAFKGPSAPLCSHVVMNASGRPIYLKKTSNYICEEDGRIVGAIESFVDLTQQREAEAALHEAKELMESARNAKRHFMANMNHEIRTPLNAIMGLLDLMLAESPTPSQQEYLRTARRSASLLMDLIEDILNFSVVDKGAVNLEVSGFSLSSIIASVIARQFDLAQNQQVAIHSHVDEEVPDNLIGDSGRVYQIIKQLVGNSIKFTPAGEVAVRVARVPAPPAALDQDPRKVVLRFSISDTGVGIPKEKLDHIFHALSQVNESSTRLFGGLGIGLNIVHRLIVMMEGRIWIESVQGQGTTVHFVVPFKVAASGETEKAPAPSNAGRVWPSAPVRGDSKAGTMLLGAKEQTLSLAPAQLPGHWAAQFHQLKITMRSDRRSAERTLIRLKAEAKEANQPSLETLLFRLLLAVRRDDAIHMEHFHSMIARKIVSGETMHGIAEPGGGKP